MGLTPEEYAPGRIIKRDGENMAVRGTLSDSQGGRFLIVSQVGQPMAALLAEEDVRDDQDDHYEAVSQEDADTIRQEAADGADQEPDNTDGTDGTPSADSPNAEADVRGQDATPRTETVPPPQGPTEPTP